MNLRLHPKYGVNPTVTCCFYCGKEKNEVALLGAGYRGEAPSRMVIDRVPCDWCQGNMKQGIVFVAVTGGGSRDARPTGQYLVLTEEAAGRILSEPMRSQVLQKRLALIDQTAWHQFGFQDACESAEQP